MKNVTKLITIATFFAAAIFAAPAFAAKNVPAIEKVRYQKACLIKAGFRNGPDFQIRGIMKKKVIAGVVIKKKHHAFFYNNDILGHPALKAKADACQWHAKK